jgi:hypothetical protein
MVMRSRTSRSVRAKANTALVGEQFTHGANATGTEVIDVIHHTFAALQPDQIFGGSNDIT